MSFFTSWPKHRYPKNLPIHATDGFDIAAAQALMWASQLAYECSDGDKLTAILGRWNWRLDGRLLAPLASTLPILSVEGFVASRDGVSVLAFPGTEPTSLPEWIRNLQVQTDARGIHSGFAAAADAVWATLVPILRAGGAAGGTPLYVTGHSLGGAVAAVAAERLVREGVVPVERIAGVYTYGMPRPGNELFASAYRDPNRNLDARTFRFVYGADLVPRVPPPDGGFNYRHVGRVLSSARNGFFDGPPVREAEPAGSVVLTAVDTLFDTLLSVTDRGNHEFPGNPLARAVIEHLPAPLRDHVPDGYLRALRALDNFPPAK